jgi:hypothetical protein
MALRASFFIAAFLAFATDATAAEFGLGHRASCTIVRFYVAKYSAPAAEAWARSKGATEAEIEAARRCLSPTLTAQAAPTIPN